MSTPLTLEALEVLDAIARKGSFAAAASELYKVPSAVSYTIRKLEQELGISLFNRDGHRAILTPAGELLLRQGRYILEAAEGLVDAARHVSMGWEPKLTLFLHSLLPHAPVLQQVQHFHQQHQGTQLALMEEWPGDPWDALLNNQLDLIIGAPVPTLVDSRIAVHEIGQWPQRLVAHPQHPLALGPQNLELEAIKPYLLNLACTQDRSHTSPVSHLTVSHISTLIQSLLMGLGVAHLPELLVQPLIAQGQLVSLEEASSSPSISLCMAWRKHAQGQALQWFMNQLQLINWQQLSGPMIAAA